MEFGIYSLMLIFVGHPLRAIFAATFFLLAFSLTIKMPKRFFAQPRHLMLTSCSAWFVYSIWEAYCTCINANIRIDIFLIAPLLFGISVFTIIMVLINVVIHVFKKLEIKWKKQ